MRQCKKCKKEIDLNAHKARKFCSDSCRVLFHFQTQGMANLGAVKPIQLNLGLIEEKDNQFKPNNKNDFGTQYAAASLGAATGHLLNNALSTEKLSKEDFDNFKKELKKDLFTMNETIKRTYYQNQKLLEILK